MVHEFLFIIYLVFISGFNLKKSSFVWKVCENFYGLKITTFLYLNQSL